MECDSTLSCHVSVEMFVVQKEPKGGGGRGKHHPVDIQKLCQLLLDHMEAKEETGQQMSDTEFSTQKSCTQFEGLI